MRGKIRNLKSRIINQSTPFCSSQSQLANSQITLGFADLLWMIRAVCLARLRGFAIRTQAKYVWYNVPPTSAPPSILHAQRHLYMGLSFGIWVFFGVLAKPLK